MFLSIGYSTCHWCHVIEEESFGDPSVARIIDEVFVSRKVDREERPDFDDHCTPVSKALTGGSGWPLSIVMIPDGNPFCAAICVPRGNAYGRMGMLELVPRIGELCKSCTTTDAATATCCTGGFSNPWGTTSRSTSPAWVRPGARS